MLINIAFILSSIFTSILTVTLVKKYIFTDEDMRGIERQMLPFRAIILSLIAILSFIASFIFLPMIVLVLIVHYFTKPKIRKEE